MNHSAAVEEENELNESIVKWGMEMGGGRKEKPAVWIVNAAGLCDFRLMSLI